MRVVFLLCAMLTGVVFSQSSFAESIGVFPPVESSVCLVTFIDAKSSIPEVGARNHVSALCDQDEYRRLPILTSDGQSSARAKAEIAAQLAVFVKSGFMIGSVIFSKWDTGGELTYTLYRKM